MNITSPTILVNSFIPPQNNKNTSFVITMDPFYIGTFIGLVGAFIVVLIRLHYLYIKKRHMSNSHSVVIEKHTNVHDVIKTTIDLSV